MPPSFPRPLRHPLRSASAVIRWPVESQAHARRNALVANTELSLHRAEREEVERFLGALPPVAVPPQRTAR
jgi:hypothetical protein